MSRPNPNMRSPEFLARMHQLGMRVVADPSDPAWDGEKQRKHTAYRVRDRVEVHVHPWTVCYTPEHPDDWDEHPDAFRALDMLGYQCASPRGPASVRPWRLNSLFFSVSREFVIKLFFGERTVEDLLIFLESRSTPA